MNTKTRYLLDTNVVFETRKIRPDSGVISFLSEVDGAILFVSVLTIGELYKGLEMKRRTDSEKASLIAEWIVGIERNFSDRVLDVSASIARRWGELSADRPRPVIDTLIAATALEHALTLLTRNVDDFAGIGLDVVNPWNEGT